MCPHRKLVHRSSFILETHVSFSRLWCGLYFEGFFLVWLVGFLERDQLCTVPGDIQELHLAAWGWYHFHDTGSGSCGLTVLCGVS